MSVGRPTFHWADYLVFVGVLLVSASVGIFYAFAGGRQRTAREYLMANRQMSVFPTSVSILMSFMSAVLVLGTPAEMYTKGAMMWLQIFGMSMQAVISAIFFVPLMYPLHFTSSYEVCACVFRSIPLRLADRLLPINNIRGFPRDKLNSPNLRRHQKVEKIEWSNLTVRSSTGRFVIRYQG